MRASVLVLLLASVCAAAFSGCQRVQRPYGGKAAKVEQPNATYTLVPDPNRSPVVKK